MYSSIYQVFIEIGPVVLPLWVVEDSPFPLLRPFAYIQTACRDKDRYRHLYTKAKHYLAAVVGV